MSFHFKGYGSCVLLAVVSLAVSAAYTGYAAFDSYRLTQFVSRTVIPAETSVCSANERALKALFSQATKNTADAAFLINGETGPVFGPTWPKLVVLQEPTWSTGKRNAFKSFSQCRSEVAGDSSSLCSSLVCLEVPTVEKRCAGCSEESVRVVSDFASRMGIETGIQGVFERLSRGVSTVPLLEVSREGTSTLRLTELRTRKPLNLSFAAQSNECPTQIGLDLAVFLDALGLIAQKPAGAAEAAVPRRSYVVSLRRGPTCLRDQGASAGAIAAVQEFLSLVVRGALSFLADGAASETEAAPLLPLAVLAPILDTGAEQRPVAHRRILQDTPTPQSKDPAVPRPIVLWLCVSLVFAFIFAIIPILSLTRINDPILSSKHYTTHA